MTIEGNEDEGREDEGMEARHDPRLWELLGKQPPVKISPYFARKVLREIEARTRPEGGGSPLRWLHWLRLPQVAAFGGAFATVVLVLCLHGPFRGGTGALRQTYFPRGRAATVQTGIADVNVQDVEVIADLDNMLASEETSLWTDDSAVF